MQMVTAGIEKEKRENKNHRVWETLSRRERQACAMIVTNTPTSRSPTGWE